MERELIFSKKDLQDKEKFPRFLVLRQRLEVNEDNEREWAGMVNVINRKVERLSKKLKDSLST